MNELFAQLGLESSDEAIEQFIKTHQLSDDIPLNEAPFFNDAQKAFINEAWRADAVFVTMVEELNVRLHGG
ncbi:MAG: DUF2789 family protein [Acinetobacter sp.]|nr:DUF2789 family protein [Acinetobacter sp.]